MNVLVLLLQLHKNLILEKHDASAPNYGPRISQQVSEQLWGQMEMVYVEPNNTQQRL